METLDIQKIECLEKEYAKLIEEVRNYKYIDEVKSDNAAFLAMKTLEKLNRYNYLFRII